MEARVGDRVSLDAKKVGQPRRSGVIEGVSEGISGVRYSVRWDDGSATTINPGAGILTVERRSNSKRTPAKTGAKTKTKAKTGAKAKAKASSKTRSAAKARRPTRKPSRKR